MVSYTATPILQTTVWYFRILVALNISEQHVSHLHLLRFDNPLRTSGHISKNSTQRINTFPGPQPSRCCTCTIHKMKSRELPPLSFSRRQLFGGFYDFFESLSHLQNALSKHLFLQVDMFVSLLHVFPNFLSLKSTLFPKRPSLEL